MQAAIQPFIDGAVSKTINLPQSATDEDVEGLILEASRLEIKGCALFSPDASNENVLGSAERSKSKNTPGIQSGTTTPVHDCSRRPTRPRATFTRKGN